MKFDKKVILAYSDPAGFNIIGALIDEFIANHHPPINIRWAIQKHQQEMKREKVIVRFGKRILIHPENFWKWLFEREEKAKK